MATVSAGLCCLSFWDSGGWVFRGWWCNLTFDTLISNTGLMAVTERNFNVHVKEVSVVVLSLGLGMAVCADEVHPWMDVKKTPEERAKILTANMTLEEQADELSIHYVHDPELYAVFTNRLAKGRTFGAIMKVRGAREARELQELALGHSRLKIPLIFHEDVTHGFRTVLPVGLGSACTWNVRLVEACEEMAAREAAAGGYHLTYAPMCDISDDPRWGRICETSGEDPYLSASMTAVRVRGLRKHLAACIKHFAGYAALRAGRDYHPADFSLRELEETYLPPYRAAIAEGVDMFMCAYTPFDADDCTFNRFLNRDILRGELGFVGGLMTDMVTIASGVRYGISSGSEESARRAIEAGIDMDMRSDAYNEWLPKLVRAGEVKAAWLGKACERCLAVKFRLGLFDDPFARGCDESAEEAAMITPANRALAREAVRQGAVLLENNGVLPLSVETKIAVAGPLADAPHDQLGDWPCFGRDEEVITPLKAFRETWGKNLVSAEAAETVVYCGGEFVRWGGEQRSRQNPDIPESQLAEMRRYKARGKKVVAVILSCRPLVLTELVKTADAVVFAFFPGTEGGHGLADIVSGAFNPCGRLVQTFPRAVGQIPLSYRERRPWRETQWVDGESTPLYPFGYGLSYTTFDCSTPIWKDGAAHVTVSNTGRRDGTTVVQVYLRHDLASVVQRGRELKAFARVGLKAGERREVSLALEADAFKIFNAEHRWVDERKPCTLFVGFDASTTNGVSCVRD